MATTTARNGDIELFVNVQGDPGAPAVVLVNGAGSTSVMWPDVLVDELLAAGHRVVRFDNRDVGRSTRLPASVDYTLADLASDLAAVLDHLDIGAAHLLGRSMGGATVMAFAADAPERARSLTLVYTSPCLGMPHEHGLRGPRRAVLEAMAEEAAAGDPATDADRIDRLVGGSRLMAGTRYEFDEAWARAEAVADVAHAPFARHGHGFAVMRSPSLVPLLDRLTMPTLVVHGTDDPIVDIGHGRFLAEHIATARLLELDGLGHEMPPAMATEILPELLAHLGEA